MTFIRFLLTFLLYATPIMAQNFEQGFISANEVGDALDISGDLLQNRLSLNDCTGICASIYDCQGFTWTKDRNGTCSFTSTNSYRNWRNRAILKIVKDLTCRKIHKPNKYLCEKPNDPCYFFSEADEDKSRYEPDMSQFLEILPENGCTNDTQLLIGVIGRPCDFEGRRFIRQHWSHSSLRKNDTKLIFLVGNGQNPTINQAVILESKLHGDILKLDMIEDYRNLSLKTFGLLNYAHLHCQNLKCLEKSDSDTTVNIQGLEKICDRASGYTFKIIGHLMAESEPQRSPWNKWYVPNYVYPDGRYPKFTSGTNYMMIGYGIASHMLETADQLTGFMHSENLRLMPEDVMWTGIVRDDSGIDVEGNPGFALRMQGAKNPWEYVNHFLWCDPDSKTSAPLCFENSYLNRDTWKEVSFSRKQAWEMMQEIIGSDARC